MSTVPVIRRGTEGHWINPEKPAMAGAQATPLCEKSEHGWRRREPSMSAWMSLWLLVIGICQGSRGLSQPVFSNALKLGTVAVPGLNQASGVVSSRNNDAVLWTHNDSGDVPRIFAIDTQGRHLGTYRLAGATHVDYEDIAIGPGPVPNVTYLYVGDIGDNKSVRTGIQVYRIPEPAVYLRQASAPPTADLKGLVAIPLRYPDGPHNAETLLIDPLTGDLFVITKQPGIAGIYRASRSQLNEAGVVGLTRVGEIPFNVANGGDTSPNGREIIIRQEDFARLWTRTSHQSVMEALLSTPTAIPVVGRPTEPNGEAIGFDRFGSGYFTLSDGAATQPLYYFPRANAPSIKTPHTLVAAAGSWRYLDNGSAPGSGWRTNGFDDKAWRSGEAQFGYGDGDEQTVVSYGMDGNAKHLTTYFRTTFVVTKLPDSFRLELRLLFNDGAAVFLNGALVALENLTNDPTSLTLAFKPRAALEDAWAVYEIDPAPLLGGTNTLAIEIHLSDAARPHLSLDAQLLATEFRPMKITSLTKLRDGQPQLHMESDLPELTVEATTNWTTWISLGGVSLTNGNGTFDLPRSPVGPHQFFRLRSQ